jgi:hypothetical protein
MSAINQTTWRQTPHIIDGYLKIKEPETVFSCNVNQSSFIYPIAQITYDGGAGDYEDVVVGQTIRVTSSTGVFKGFLRVRAAPTASVIYFGHVSQGEIYFANNDIFTVLNDFRHWSRLPFYPEDGTLYKDWDLAFAGQTLPPVCVAGPDRAKFVSGGVASFDFDLTDSYLVDDGASSLDYSAVLPSGVSVSSGSIVSGEFTLECDPGDYYVHFTVTDDLGATHTRHVRIYAAEKTGANAPMRCAVESMTSSLEQGTEAKFALLADTLDITAFYDGAPVLFFVEEDYGATGGSINGYADAENVAFVGWLRSIEISQQPGLSDVVVDCAGSFGLAELHRAFPLSVQRSASPSDWDQVADLSIWKQVVYLLHWQSTLLNVSDLEKPSWADTYNIADRLESQYGSIIDQMQFLANAVGGKFTCDLQGRCFINKYPPLMTTIERTGLTTVLTLEAQDWTGDIQIRKRNYANASWVRGAAVLQSTSEIKALASIAPGTSPAQGIIEEQTNHHIVASQSELNERTGHKFALVNMQYETFSIEVFRAGRPIDPAWQQVIKFDNPAALNRRGLAFTTDDLFVVADLDIEFDHEIGATSEKWTVQLVTSGVPGTTVPVVENVLDDFNYVPYIPWTPLDFYLPEPITELPGTPDLDFADVTRMYACTRSDLCLNESVSSPSWSSVVNAVDLLGTGWQFFRFRVDPWRIGNGAVLTAINITTGELRILEADTLSSPVPQFAEQHSFLSTTGLFGYADARYSINIEGLIAVTHFDRGDHSARLLRRPSQDGTWVDEEVYDAGASNGSEIYSLGMGSHQIWPNGDMYMIVNSQVGGSHLELWKSSDLGNTWVADLDLTGVLTRLDEWRPTIALALPYLNNADDEVVWIFSSQNDANSVIRRESNGSLTTGLGPLISGSDYHRLANISVPDLDLAAANACVIDNSDSDKIRFLSLHDSVAYLVYSENGGADWTAKSLSGLTPNQDIYGLGGWPNDSNLILLYGRSWNVGYTPDLGDTYIDLIGTGDGALSAVSTDDEVVDFVPIWA